MSPAEQTAMHAANAITWARRARIAATISAVLYAVAILLILNGHR
jgi:hypothetical protein